jgi:tripartite-type tricarboxylate transporter receptor subunit TctC
VLTVILANYFAETAIAQTSAADRFKAEEALYRPWQKGKIGSDFSGEGRQAERLRGYIKRSVFVAATLCATTPAVAQSVAAFYAGKQINFIVGASPGGGYDTQARLVARHLGKHIPGNPTIVVQNMPAAGSLAATNYIYNVAAKDGTVIALVMRGMLLIKNWNPTSVRFDLARLNWLGSINSEVAVTAAWHTAPHKTAKDLFERELIVGGTAGVDPETTPRLFNALLGTKFKIINGYPGTTEIILAMEKGELQGIGDWSWSSMKVARPDWLRDKKITLLMQAALQKEPELADVPSALDFVRNDADRKVMELYLTQKAVARPVIAPPNIPTDRLAALRNGFITLAQDREFLTDAKRTQLEVAPISGAAVDEVISLITSASPEAAERLGKAIAPADK